MKSLLEVTGLEKVFRDTRAVGGLSFGVKSGEIVGLVGPNGAGKTTTLRCAAGVIPPRCGSILTLLALLPAGIVAGGAFMLLRPALGMAAAPIAAALGAAAIAAALLPVVRLLGRAIERLDPEP